MDKVRIASTKIVRAVYTGIGLIFGAPLISVILGSLYLNYDARSFQGDIKEPCDNVVVLTGGKDRIRYVLEIIKNSRNFKPKNIFISGVHQKTNLGAILAANMNVENIEWCEKVGRCRFILGKEARNTLENADEVDNWIRKNKVNKIVLVTSDYHMRRSVMVLKHKNPSIEIIPCAVLSHLDKKGATAYMGELLKLVYTWISFWFD